MYRTLQMMRGTVSVLEGLRILVLEDEFLIAMDVEQLCSDHGAGEVVIARNLADIAAPEDIASRFDVAIVDLMLDGQSTLEFAGSLKERGVPFIFASGYGDVEEIRRSFPGVAMIGKPYAGADLVEAVAAAVAGAQAADDPIT